MEQGHDWTIWLAEKAVGFNAATDIRVFGKPFSHPFLVFKTPAGDVVSEIHGVWPTTDATHHISCLINNFTAAVRNEKAVICLKSFTARIFPRTALIATKGQYHDDEAAVRQALFTGTLPEARGIWQNLFAQFETLNAKRLPFYQYASPSNGFSNCQTILHRAMESAGTFHVIPDLKLAQTGWTASPKTDISLQL